jgi:hypothetical protein
MQDDMLSGYILFFGFAFLLLTPFFIYQIFFYKKDKQSGSSIRNFFFSKENTETFLSKTNSFGFTQIENEEDLDPRYQYSQSNAYLDAAVYRGEEEERVFIILDRFRHYKGGSFVRGFFAQNLILAKNVDSHDRETIAKLPFLKIIPIGTFGYDDDGKLEDTRSVYQRFQDSIKFYSRTKIEMLQPIFDDPDLQAAIIDAFDLGVAEISIQHQGFGVQFEYLHLDVEEWTEGQIERIVTALSTIVKRLPPVENVAYTKGELTVPKWNIVFWAISFVLVLVFTDAAYETSCLQPEKYQMLMIPLPIIIIVLTYFTWPKTYIKPIHALLTVGLNILFAYGISPSLEYLVNRAGMPTEVIQLKIIDKKIVQETVKRYRIYFEAPEGSNKEVYADVGGGYYEKIVPDTPSWVNTYGEVRFVTGRFGFTYLSEVELKKNKPKKKQNAPVAQ